MGRLPARGWSGSCLILETTTGCSVPGASTRTATLPSPNSPATGSGTASSSSTGSSLPKNPEKLGPRIGINGGGTGGSFSDPPFEKREPDSCYARSEAQKRGPYRERQ